MGDFYQKIRYSNIDKGGVEKMKVKCRGFEGNLISLNPTEEYM